MQQHPTNQNSELTLRRPWVGIALLSASWLFGLSYYHGAQWLSWAVLMVAGTILLMGVTIRRPTARQCIAVSLMLIPVIWFTPWPHRLLPIFIFAGLLLTVVPIPRRWPQVFASAALLAGAILLAQSLAIAGYEYVTARSHELPRPLPDLLFGLARLLGIEATLDGTDLILNTPRAAHRLGATWELFLDPPTLSFLVGGIVILCLAIPAIHTTDTRTLRLKRSLSALVFAVVVWLPIRTAILMSMFMHRALRTDYDSPLALMNQFWNPWLHLFFLLGPVLLAWRFVTLPRGTFPQVGPDSQEKLSRQLAAVVLAVLGVFSLCMGLMLDTSGNRKSGRILVDEFHSEWERTDKPFDTDWYGQESGYNYACIYDYCSHFYQIGRLNTAVDANALSNCDVLVVKVPTSRYSSREVAAIKHFVENGGGLLLIGEHTSVFNTGTYLNDIAAGFGFRFRYDCLFGIDTVFDELYRSPVVSHPIVQNMPPLNFAVSCSIDPGVSIGKAVIRSTGLKNLPADYHASNFYPQVEDQAEMRYGAFVQLWSVRHGKGRVLAFTDSTIFSNFSAFEPGKAELMLGMLEWLNHINPSFDLRILLVPLGILFFAGGLVLTTGWWGAWVIVLAASMLGWTIAGTATRAIHRYSMPLPNASQPMVRVIIDRTVCNSPLSKSGFISGSKDGFGIFERWILRLGYFTSRRSSSDALVGDLVVFMHPNQTVTEEFRNKLLSYVSSGGNVLVIDSPDNTDSTANSLLYPFDLTVKHDSQYKGSLIAPQSWPTIDIESAYEVKGGQPMMQVQDVPVAATVHHGKGTVTAMGFGSRFTDVNMGVTGDAVPDETLRQVYELQFRMLRAIVSGS